jgi:hypothetical protein
MNKTKFLWLITFVLVSITFFIANNINTSYFYYSIVLNGKNFVIDDISIELSDDYAVLKQYDNSVTIVHRDYAPSEYSVNVSSAKVFAKATGFELTSLSSGCDRIKIKPDHPIAQVEKREFAILNKSILLLSPKSLSNYKALDICNSVKVSTN